MSLPLVIRCCLNAKLLDKSQKRFDLVFKLVMGVRKFFSIVQLVGNFFEDALGAAIKIVKHRSFAAHQQRMRTGFNIYALPFGIKPIQFLQK